MYVYQTHGANMSSFYWDSPGIMDLKQLCTSVQQNSVRDTKCPGFSRALDVFQKRKFLVSPGILNPHRAVRGLVAIPSMLP
jgi:hypothetical protein